MQRRDSSRRVAAEAVAPLYGGDDALEVGAVEQLGELQEAVAQHEELVDTERRENSQSNRVSVGGTSIILHHLFCSITVAYSIV